MIFVEKLGPGSHSIIKDSVWLAECSSFEMQVYNQEENVVLVLLLLGYYDSEKQNLSCVECTNN